VTPGGVHVCLCVSTICDASRMLRTDKPCRLVYSSEVCACVRVLCVWFVPRDSGRSAFHFYRV